jgi:non-ribosomal peptide synthetase component F
MLLDVMEHSFFPYESILEAAGLKSDTFPVMFVYHEDPPMQAKIFKDTCQVVRSLSNNVKPKFPLPFNVTVKQGESDQTMQFNVDYDTRKLSATAIQSLFDHYGVLLLSASKTTKETAIGELDIITEKERNVLRQYEVQQPLANNFTPVFDLIEQRVRENPKSIACWFEADVKTTYQDLWALVKCVSEVLSTYYFQKNSRIAIFIEAGVERIASIVGTLKAGFAYVPLDTEWPPLRIAAVVENSAPELILISSNGRRKFPPTPNNVENAPTVIFLPYIQSHGKTESILLKTPSIDCSELAYIVYTSGSMGLPKGVHIEHGALMNSLDEHCRIYGLPSSSSLLQLARWTFDVSIVDIFGTLSRGAPLCLGSQDYVLSRLQDAISLMGITHLATNPTIAALLSPDSSPTLETLAIGGEPMTKTVQRVWSKALRLLNMYRPTETTLNVSYCHIQPESDVSVIGKPLRNVKYYILNDQLQEVPLGTSGQLAVGGVQLARSYTNRTCVKHHS